MPIVRAPRRLASRRHPSVNGVVPLDDAGGRGSYRNAQVHLDEVLGEHARIGGTAAPAGHDQLRWVPLKPPSQLRNGFSQQTALPRDNVRHGCYLARHPRSRHALQSSLFRAASRWASTPAKRRAPLKASPTGGDSVLPPCVEETAQHCRPPSAHPTCERSWRIRCAPHRNGWDNPCRELWRAGELAARPGRKCGRVDCRGSLMDTERPSPRFADIDLWDT
jgi:hypothetical protein